MRDVPAFELDLARVHGLEPRDGPQEGGFSAAGRSEQCGQASALDLRGDLVQRLKRAETLRDVLDSQAHRGRCLRFDVEMIVLVALRLNKKSPPPSAEGP